MSAVELTGFSNLIVEVMEKHLNRSCPVCRSEVGFFIHNQRFYIEKGNPLPDSYDVVCCVQCGFVFADVPFGQSVYDQYYNEFSKYEDENTGSGSGGKIFEYERLNETCQFLIKYAENKDLNIIDIGSAGGGLLKILSDSGYANLYALEPSTVCVDRINNDGRGKIKALAGSVLDDLSVVFSGKKFDVVVLSHVFEHVYDLSRAMHQLRSIISENGLLYIEVPDLLKYVEYQKVPFYYFDCEHINHFDKRSLRNLCGVFGFDELHVGEKAMRVSDNDYYPALYGMFRFSDESYISVVEYVSSASVYRFAFMLDGLIASQEPVVVWGAGSNTKRLLATTDLLKCNIQYFVDNDKNKHGKELCHLVVNSPEILHNFKGKILISSVLFSEEIILTIRLKGLKNECIVLNT